MKRYITIFGIVFNLLCVSESMAAKSGSCAPTDENGNPIGTCQWTLNGDTLTFSGQGPMKDYGTVTQNNLNTTDAPWNDLNPDKISGSLYQIKNVVVEDGITRVGNNVMSGASVVKNITIGDDVTSIGDSAFYACNAKNVTLGKNVETLGANAFHSNNITDFVLPEKLKSIGSYALWGIRDEILVLPPSVTNVASGLPIRTVQTLYCEESKEDLCKSLVASLSSQTSGNLSYQTYKQVGNRYVFNGTAYYSVKDFHKQEPVKRIYTVEQALKASKPTGNKILIKYK